MIEAHSLQQHLQGIIPGAVLAVTRLPDCPGLPLLLLNADYPQGDLDPQDVQRPGECCSPIPAAPCGYHHTIGLQQINFVHCAPLQPAENTDA